MSIPLSQLQPGTKGVVSKLGATGSVRQRFYDLGLLPGTHVQRLMSSPIGDPICYRIRGAMIALRSDDAAQISVEV